VKANRRNKKVTWDDFESLRDNMKLPLRVGVELRVDGKVRAGSHALNDTNVRGVTANMVDIDIVTRASAATSPRVTIKAAPSRYDWQRPGHSAFPAMDPIGHELLIDGRPFLIVGIAKTIGTAFGQSQDNFAYIPIQTYFKMLWNQRNHLAKYSGARGRMDGANPGRGAGHDARASGTFPPTKKDNFGIFDQATLMESWRI